MSDESRAADQQAPLNLDEGFRIGDFEAQPRQGTLTRSGETLRLEPKVMAVLVCLARSAGAVVSRDQFAEEVWRGRIVSDEVLSRDISMLRSHLGDNAKEPRFIQTIPRLGYRLVAPISPIEPIAPIVSVSDAGAGATPLEIMPWWRRAPLLWLLAGSAVAVVVVALVSRQPALGVPLLDTRTIAVLPFVTPPGDGEVFGYGLADEIRVSLNGVQGLRIIPGMSVMRFKEGQQDVREIGKALSAGSLLLGSVRLNDDHLKITAQLVDANTGLQLWSESYAERQLADIFKVQSEISHAIAAQLALKLDPNSGRVPTTDLVAYREFLQGRHMLRRRGAEPIGRSIELFNSAIERDPQFGRAYVGLAEAFLVEPSYTGAPEVPMFELAIAALDRADALSATEPPAPAIRALLETRRQHWFEAGEEFKTALAGDPDDSDLRQYYSQFLAYTGYIDQAVVAAQRATELDPLSPVAHQRLGVVYLWVDDNVHAAQEFKLAQTLGLAVEANPEAMVALLLRQKQFEQARASLLEIQRTRQKSEAWIAPVIAAIAGSGPRADGVAALRDAHTGGQINDRLFLGALFFVGDADSFFTAIEQAVADHIPFDVELLFMDRSSALRRHPRFAALMQQMGLVAYWDANGWPAACARNGDTVQCS